MNSDQGYSSVFVNWTKQVCLQTRLKLWQWWGTPDIIWKWVPDRRRRKRQWTITKCCLTVCRSKKLVIRLIILFLSTEIFSKRRKIFTIIEEKPEPYIYIVYIYIYNIVVLVKICRFWINVVKILSALTITPLDLPTLRNGSIYERRQGDIFWQEPLYYIMKSTVDNYEKEHYIYIYIWLKIVGCCTISIFRQQAAFVRNVQIKRNKWHKISAFRKVNNIGLRNMIRVKWR